MRPSTLEWVEQIWYIYTVNIIQPKNDEILSFEITYTELEVIVLSEIMQA
jgi:hypothetical protein